VTCNSNDSATKIYVDHCTAHIGGQNSIQFNESGTTYAGQIVEVKNTLWWSQSAQTTRRMLYDIGGYTSGGVQDVVIPSGVHHNAQFNQNLSPLAGDVRTYSGNGAACNLSAFVNTDIKTLTDLPFVDSTRNIRTWGASQGTDGSLSAAEDLLVLNPRLIAQADTGLIDWLLAGFAVTDSTLKDAGSDGVTIGAMGYVASGGGGTYRMDHRLMRPRRY
jgi:hypothetical protein